MKTEFVIFVLSCLGFMLDVLGIAGGNVIVNTALGATTAIYLLLGFYIFSNEKIDRKYVGVSIFSGILLAVSVLLILLVQQDWLGDDARGVSYFSVGSSMLIALVAKAKLGRNPHELYYRKMLLRSGIILIVGLYSATFKTDKDFSYRYDAQPEYRHQGSTNNNYHKGYGEIEEVTIEDY